MVEIINLTKKYPGQYVFNKFNYNFYEGINGLIGNNGAGKTTLFKCIYGTERYSGNINRPDSITYLPAELYFYPRIRGIEFIEFICSTKNQEVNYNAIDKINRFFKLPLKKYARLYSTGMQKKLGLMSMYLTTGDTLLLDEPFNGLDIESQAICAELMLLLKQNYKTIIVSSHITTQLTTICESIHFLNNGKISESFVKKDFWKIDEIVNDSFKQTIHTLKETFDI